MILRLGMTNPPYILNHLADIAECLNHPNVYAFLHVPVQSGSNKVLKDMNREYTREEFEQVADYMIEHVPGITIMTVRLLGARARLPRLDAAPFRVGVCAHVLPWRWRRERRTSFVASRARPTRNSRSPCRCVV